MRLIRIPSNTSLLASLTLAFDETQNALPVMDTAPAGRVVRNDRADKPDG